MPTEEALEQARRLAGRNIAFLRQGQELIAALTDADFSATAPSGLRGGVGPHFRHVLDHYECFLDGLDARNVDYDRRERDPSVETQRGAADAKIEQIVERLARLSPADADVALSVRVDSGEGGERHVSHSSVGRELQFLVSHTVHHYAVIAVMLRVRGIDPGRDFGVAPSTLKHELATR